MERNPPQKEFEEWAKMVSTWAATTGTELRTYSLLMDQISKGLEDLWYTVAESVANLRQTSEQLQEFSSAVVATSKSRE